MQTSKSWAPSKIKAFAEKQQQATVMEKEQGAHVSIIAEEDEQQAAAKKKEQEADKGIDGELTEDAEMKSQPSSDEEEESLELSFKEVTPRRVIFSDTPLRVTVIKAAPVSQKNDVTNIEFQDANGTKVRLVLWGKNTEYLPVFEKNLGKTILLGNVIMDELADDKKKYAIDRRFPYQLYPQGALDVRPADVIQMQKLEDFIGAQGIIKGPDEGHLMLKVGRAPVEIKIDSESYKSVILHNGVYRVSLYFPSAIDVAKLKKPEQIILHMARLVRDGDETTTLCFIDSPKDFTIVNKPERQNFPDVKLAELPDLFSRAVVDKVKKESRK